MGPPHKRSVERAEFHKSVVQRESIAYGLVDNLLLDARAKSGNTVFWEIVHSQMRLKTRKRPDGKVFIEEPPVAEELIVGSKSHEDNFVNIKLPEGKKLPNVFGESHPLPKAISPGVAEMATKRTLEQYHISSEKTIREIVVLMRKRAKLLSELADLCFKMKNRNIGEYLFKMKRKVWELRVQLMDSKVQDLLKVSPYRSDFLTVFNVNENVIKSHIVSTAVNTRRRILQMEGKD